MIWYAILWVVMTMGITVMLCGRLIAARVCPEDNVVELILHSSNRPEGRMRLTGLLSFMKIAVCQNSKSAICRDTSLAHK